MVGRCESIASFALGGFNILVKTAAIEQRNYPYNRVSRLARKQGPEFPELLAILCFFAFNFPPEEVMVLLTSFASSRIKLASPNFTPVMRRAAR